MPGIPLPVSPRCSTALVICCESPGTAPGPAQHASLTAALRSPGINNAESEGSARDVQKPFGNFLGNSCKAWSAQLVASWGDARGSLGGASSPSRGCRAGMGPCHAPKPPSPGKGVWWL